jgi:uncharacterized protein (DUF1015 family)
VPELSLGLEDTEERPDCRRMGWILQFFADLPRRRPAEAVDDVHDLAFPARERGLLSGHGTKTYLDFRMSQWGRGGMRVAEAAQPGPEGLEAARRARHLQRMVTLDPISRALVAADSEAADKLGAPNYDEFQSDREVWELLREKPWSVLRVTMPHCDVRTPEDIGEEGSKATLARAVANMARLMSDPMVRKAMHILWVYEITRPGHEDRPQIGIGGLARTGEIRTPENPKGTVIRNEGIREVKAKGRALLTQVTHTDMGTVNLAVDDDSGELSGALGTHAKSHEPNFETHDEMGNRHRVWLVDDPKDVERFQALLAREPHAYVADGNHRSAAAAMLGYEHYLAVVFPKSTMTIAPYNRLVDVARDQRAALVSSVQRSFQVERHAGPGPLQPTKTHDIGLYEGSSWWHLQPKPGTFDPNDAAQDIDADIVQRRIMEQVLGVTDARDDRITYVGANRDAAWLQAQVDEGLHGCAITLPPVTMEQFIRVCLQDKLMPPKSTWFVPKIRSGLVMAMV